MKSGLGIDVSTAVQHVGRRLLAGHVHSGADVRADTATLLGTNRIAVVGGSDETERELPTIEIFDPAGGAWVEGPKLLLSRVFHVAAELSDGSVFVAAGKLSNKRFLETTERLDANGETWVAGPDLADSRTAPAMAPLASGRLLLAGGLHGSTAGFKGLSDASIYDPNTGKWSVIGSMKGPRYYHSATTLADGRVLMCGGLGASGKRLPHASSPSPDSASSATLAP